MLNTLAQDPRTVDVAAGMDKLPGPDYCRPSAAVLDGRETASMKNHSSKSALRAMQRRLDEQNRSFLELVATQIATTVNSARLWGRTQTC
jgi:hypothetical protein